MSLFFREKRFQRHHPDVFRQRMALTIPCVSSLRVTPHQVLESLHCSLHLDQLGTSRRQNFSEQSSRSSSRQRFPTSVQTPPGFQTFSRSSPQGCRTILLPQGSSAICRINLPAFKECPVASQLLLRSLLPLQPAFPTTINQFSATMSMNACSVSVQMFTRQIHEEQSSLSTAGGQSVRAVVNVM